MNDVLSWPVAPLPLKDEVDLYVHPYDPSITPEDARGRVAVALPAITAKVKRSYPSALDVRTEIYSKGETLHGRVITETPWVLCVRARFAEPLLPHQFSHARMLLLAVLCS